MGAREMVTRLFAEADVQINGGRSHDLVVRKKTFYDRVFQSHSLGLGESYVEAEWDCVDIAQMICQLLRVGVNRRRLALADIPDIVSAHLTNRQSPSRSYVVGERHYDRDPKMYKAMLGESAIYSCAYWRKADTLEQAQEAKLDLIWRKLQLRSGMTVLDIGCGWGGLAENFARKGATVLGVTISKEQAQVATYRGKGLPVRILLQDYRDLDGRFDRIVSVGMLEHVGPKNYDRFFKVVRRCLWDDGLALIHTIGCDRNRCRTDPFLDKYIFPNSVIPSQVGLMSAIDKHNLVLEDWHNFGADYDRTLLAWHDNLIHHPDLKKWFPTDRDWRQWKYYLLSCAGSFRARFNQVWQMVLSPAGVSGGYESVR